MCQKKKLGNSCPPATDVRPAGFSGHDGCGHNVGAACTHPSSSSGHDQGKAAGACPVCYVSCTAYSFAARALLAVLAASFALWTSLGRNGASAGAQQAPNSTVTGGVWRTLRHVGLTEGVLPRPRIRARARHRHHRTRAAGPCPPIGPRCAPAHISRGRHGLLLLDGADAEQPRGV